MFKIILCFCCLISFFQIDNLLAITNNKSIECAAQLRSYLNKIEKVPEARTLINEVRKEGSIHIKTSEMALAKQFGACYDTENRIIYVNIAAHRTEGALIGSILFELHNALVNSKLDALDRLALAGKIDKENYVKQVEYLEYQNSIKASKIAEKGIKMGVFPKDAQMFTYPNFEEHYRMQKVGGHSAWIAKSYDLLKRV